MKRDSALRRGRYVWVVGPDGCGKSSVAASLASSTGAVHLYWRPGLLPMAREAIGRPRVEGVNTRPHEVLANSPLRQAARLTYYLIDYVAGYWLKLRPELRSGRDVIIERAWADMSVDWRRYGLRGTEPVRRLGRLVHEPDVVLVVRVAPEEAHRRKPELPVGEIRRQYAAWRAYPFRRAAVHVLDNDVPLEQSTQAALAIIRTDAS
jgi:thymidylate kinase